MNEELKFLGGKVLEKKFQIAERVHKSRVAGLTAAERMHLPISEEDIIKMRASFVSLIGEAIEQGMGQETAFENLLVWGKETGEFVYNLGIPLNEALKDTRYYRSFIWDTLKEEIRRSAMSVETVFELGGILDPLLDQAAYSFSLTYVHFHQESLERAQNAFLELSVPVVPLTEGAAILPLIGHIDTDRANLIMEETLNAANRLKLTQLILDLSGVAVIDTMVVNQIFKVINSLTLLGVETVITGIRPEVSQTIVSIGIDFGDLKVKANLQQALSQTSFVK